MYLLLWEWWDWPYSGCKSSHMSNLCVSCWLCVDIGNGWSLTNYLRDHHCWCGHSVVVVVLWCTKYHDSSSRRTCKQHNTQNQYLKIVMFSSRTTSQATPTESGKVRILVLGDTGVGKVSIGNLVVRAFIFYLLHILFRHLFFTSFAMRRQY